MKNRTELAKYFAELGFKVGAEVGVAAGRYAEIICQQNPGVKLYCIDYWGSYGEYVDYRRQSTFDEFYETAKARLSPYNCQLIKKFSMDAVKDFKDQSLDFVFIDAHHGYRYVRDDVREWSKKVRAGGIVAGHDYFVFPNGRRGVIKAVDEYAKEYGYKLMSTDWDHDNPEPDDRQPSWYFVKT